MISNSDFFDDVSGSPSNYLGPDESDEEPLDTASLEMRQLQEQQDIQALGAEVSAAFAMLNEASTHPFPDDANQDTTDNPGEEEEELSDVGWLDSQHTLPFITGLEEATIDNDFVDKNMKHQLLNPLQDANKIEPKSTLLAALKVFRAVSGSREKYESIRSAWSGHSSEVQLPSFYSIRKLIRDETGVTSVPGDMCIKGCVAFSGPFADLNICPTCGEHRFDPTLLERSGGKTKSPRLQYHSIPKGPIIQSFWRSVEVATALRHRRKETIKILKEINTTKVNHTQVVNDVYCSQDYIDAMRGGWISMTDTILMLSLDGAQLYAHKASDVWIGIWVNLDLPPELRYKKRFVTPAFVIPGPNKPKNMDSFLYTSLHHIAALQRDGLRIWDAVTREEFTTYPFILLCTADGPGSSLVSGLVSHTGYRGCRLRCNITGRRKDGAPTYYPVLLKPGGNYNIPGCTHADLDASRVATCTTEDYQRCLALLAKSNSKAEYDEVRKLTGICKRSIFQGISRKLDLPKIFPGDMMHLGSLNLPELFLKLWRGTLDRHGDDVSTWDWAVLRGDTWLRHGQRIVEITPYLPSCFGPAPRNLAEKVSSGFKAKEFKIWFYIYGPGVLHGVLPDKYWQHYCKLVMGMRLAHQRSITATQIRLLNGLFISFYKEFEEFYIRRDPRRIHFARQSVHATLHIGSEAFRIGPHAYYAQWTMERAIGDLGQEVKQPSNPFANLSQ